MGKVRCAVLGLGRLGYWHAENLAHRIPQAELLMVVDTRKELAEKIAAELGVPSHSSNPDEAFRRSDIDAVVIVTPTSTHADLIVRAASHGKHIFVEKPITQTLEEADRAIEAVRRHNVFCQVGFMRRFDPAYREAWKRIRNGDIGKPIYFKGTSRDGNVPHASFIATSGGIFLDVAIHDYDIARFLMGSEIESVLATGNVLVNDFLKEYQDVDQGMTILRFSDGSAGDVETMRIAPYGYDIRGEVIGTEGVIRIGSIRRHDIDIYTYMGKSYELIPDFPSRFKDAYLLEMVHFIESIANNTKPSCTEEDGRTALRVAIAATESFRTGREVRVMG